MNEILTAVIPVVIIGVICAVMLVVASKLMAVEEDERLPKVRECLPGANCGACGYAGCDGYAKALVEDESVPSNLCVPGADAVSRQLSEVLGVEFADVVEQVAIIHCGGDCNHTQKNADYHGMESCAAAKLFYGGGGSCSYGCIGLGDCMNVCPQNAIYLENGIAHVNYRLCIGCGMCAKACPNHLISVTADVERVVVTCNNKDKGAVTRKVCSNGCIGCKKCEKVCSSGAIKVTDNVAVIDYDKCPECDDFGACARSCTAGCIIIDNLSGIHRTV